MRFGSQRLGAAALPLLSAAALIALWEVAARLIGPDAGLPGALETLGRAAELLGPAGVWGDLAATGARWLGGVAPALVLGALLGLAVGVSEAAYRGLVPVIDFFRSIPVTAAFPAFLMFLGVGDLSKTAMAFAATLFIVILHAAYGVRAAPPTRRLMAMSFGATPLQILVRISAFEALSHVLIGGRTALSLALIVTIVAEMLVGAEQGLGQRIFFAYQLGRPTDLYALILISGIVGYGANALWVMLERRLAPWVHS